MADFGKSKVPKPLISLRTMLVYAAFILAVYVLFMRPAVKPTALTSEQLADLVNKNQIAEVVFYSGTTDLEVKLKAEPNKEPQQVLARAVNEANLEEIRQLVKNKVPYSVVTPPNPGGWFAGLGNIFNILVPIILIWYFISMMGAARGGPGGVGGIGGAMGSFGKSKAKLYKDSGQRKTFDDVAGCDEAKEELREVVEFLKNPDKFTSVGARIPRGVILYGPPGTGKTLLAKATAGEANVPFLSLSGSDFIEMLVGVGASRVRDLYQQAAKNAPCIIFIDEIDALARARGNVRGSHEEREQTLNAILAEMDGFESRNGVITMAATNRLDILDKALLRPGRFDRRVKVGLPDLVGREEILKVHAKNKRLDAGVDLKKVAKSTTGMSGADLESVLNEAALLTARREKKAITQEEIDEAAEKVAMGPAMKSRRLSDQERKIVAYHESGHALVATLTEGADPVQVVTIIPRGPGLGYMKQLPEDRQLLSKKYLLNDVAILLGGRAAEELMFGSEAVTTGAGNDLERANAILRKMISELGMDSEVGLVVHKEAEDFWGYAMGVNASDKTKELMESRIRRALTESYAGVQALLKKNKTKLDRLAKELLKKETLNGDEVRKILQSAS